MFRGMRQRAHQLARGFARIAKENGGGVYYFDEPGNIVTIFLSPEKSKANLWSWVKGPCKDEETGIVHYIPPAGLPFSYHSRVINQFNHFFYRAALSGKFLRGRGPVVLIVCNVLGLGWLGRLKEDAAIYDCADEISEFRQARLNRAAVLAQERALIQRVDAVVTTSQRLFDSKSGMAKQAELIRNAADVQHFRKALHPNPKPADIADLKKPIVGFYGFLADWLDWELIKSIVREGKEFDWVFIGPATRDLSALRSVPNFHYLGKKKYDELPEYLAHFSCAHIPFAITPLTLNVNPVKLYEYLSAGVPVVSTPLPEIQEFGDMCRIAGNAHDYLAAVRDEVSKDTGEKRQARSKQVSNETWDERVERYCGLIRHLISVSE